MKIIDQYQSTHYLTFNGVGTNYALAPPEALPGTAYDAGQEYIERFLSGYYTVRRDMYKRGKESAKRQFKAGFRRSEMANWQDALSNRDIRSGILLRRTTVRLYNPPTGSRCSFQTSDFRLPTFIF